MAVPKRFLGYLLDSNAQYNLIDISMRKVKFRERKQKMEASTSKDLFAKELEDELMKFTCNYDEMKVGTRLVVQTEKIHQSSDMKVNVMDFPKVGGNEAEYADATECSSSFDDSDYGAEGVDAFDNSEASSHFRDDAESDINFDGSCELSRVRKKVSSHWRSFIHPIMWRCKWAELRIKKLDELAKKFDRKLEEYSRKPTLEGSGINFPQNNLGNDLRRRRKRRRAEATTDIATYMSHHNLFSYYENRGAISEAARHVLKNPVSEAAQEKVDADDESWDNGEQPCVEAGNDDNRLESILQKIDHLQSRVAEMKTRVGKLTRENAEKSDLTFHMSSPSSSGYQMPIATYIASQLLSEYNLGGVLLPESAVTNNGEANGNANGSSDRAHFVNPFGNDYVEDDDDILIDNQRVRDEMRYYEEVNIHSVTNTPALNLAVPLGRRKDAAK